MISWTVLATHDRFNARELREHLARHQMEHYKAAIFFCFLVVLIITGYPKNLDSRIADKDTRTYTLANINFCFVNFSIDFCARISRISD